MKNEIQTTEQISENILIQHLDNAGLTANLSAPEKSTYLSICKAFNLNPFKREVHVAKYGNAPMSIVTGYEVYIKRAERSGQLDGWNAVTSGSVATNDLKATVTIYRKDRAHPFVWEAYYSECVQTTRDGSVTKFWQKANFMTKKVAISQGFRLCFSDELGGMPYTSDEISEVTQDITHEVVEIDYKDALESCNDLQELETCYKSMTKDKQVEFKVLALELKEKLTKL